MKFSFYGSSISNTIPSHTINLQQCHYYITSENARNATTGLRKLTYRDDAKRFKDTSFNYVTFSGVFSERRNDKLKEYSNLVCIDIDHVNNPAQVKQELINLAALPPVLAFISPSGSGVKTVYKAPS